MNIEQIKKFLVALVTVSIQYLVLLSKFDQVRLAYWIIWFENTISLPVGARQLLKYYSGTQVVLTLVVLYTVESTVIQIFTRLNDHVLSSILRQVTRTDNAWRRVVMSGSSAVAPFALERPNTTPAGRRKRPISVWPICAAFDRPHGNDFRMVGDSTPCRMIGVI